MDQWGNSHQNNPRILSEASAILDQLGFLGVPPRLHQHVIHAAAIELRTQLARAWGGKWLRATISEHTAPDGQTLLTASLFCVQCKKIEAYVAFVDANGSFTFAAPCEEEG